ncbi:hypothetical protein RFI_01936 [Reticulomyxa filosa]|uniref:glycine--tRNA ligase n=1 Tax=Reticulomyxa filosa TaxID=46433 RepID=X6PAI1_RETFI|nr:hypothetical protein RFI_01936 [Reticulomyxa filosa]|eukprot:ETO35138.1 hypothetical protein RFI_01936 [Reticulomyxa filosa]
MDLSNVNITLVSTLMLCIYHKSTKKCVVKEVGKPTSEQQGLNIQNFEMYWFVNFKRQPIVNTLRPTFCFLIQTRQSSTRLMEAVVVRGAGLNHLNGVYAYARDTERNKPEYWRVVESNKGKKKEQDAIYRIRGGVVIPELTKDKNGLWLMYEYESESGKGIHYYAAKVNEKNPLVPPSTGWTSIGGSEPTPEISKFDVEAAKREFLQVNSKVTELKAQITQLKNSGKGNNDPEVVSLVTQMKALQPQLSELHYQAHCVDIVQKKANEALKNDLEETSKANFTYTITAEIHGGCAGLYDYGPTGNNLQKITHIFFFFRGRRKEKKKRGRNFFRSFFPKKKNFFNKKFPHIFEKFFVPFFFCKKIINKFEIGAAIKANIVQEWRNHFIVEEDMLEVESTMLTPQPVLEASGHVAKFADFMVKDEVNGNCFRADKLLEQHIEKLLDPTANNTQLSSEEKQDLLLVKAEVGSYGKEQLAETLERLRVKAPETGNPLSAPFPFNLMFGTQIGPSGKYQGIFVNFQKLWLYNNKQMPFAAAQIGHAFRNEIAPRGGLIRVREFQMAEIEHFCTDDVNEVPHPKFDNVKHVRMRLLPREAQTGEEKVHEMTIDEAVNVHKIISNTTLGYYLARTQLFLSKIGINPNKLRFRQHLKNEMAHYARDCWDAEILMTQGWIDHGRQIGGGKGVERASQNQVHFKTDQQKNIQQEYKKEAEPLLKYLNDLMDKDALALLDKLKTAPVTISIDSKTYNVTDKMFDCKETEKNVQSYNYVPSVVEPSFGIGRILYALLEHSFWERCDDKNRRVLSLPPRISPIKVFVYSLSSNRKEQQDICERLHAQLKKYHLASRIDLSTASPGKKYSRADQMGVPFHVTVDFQTEKDSTTSNPS